MLAINSVAWWDLHRGKIGHETRHPALVTWKKGKTHLLQLHQSKLGYQYHFQIYPVKLFTQRREEKCVSFWQSTGIWPKYLVHHPPPSSQTSLLTPTTDIHYRGFNKKSRLLNCDHIKVIHSSYDNCQVPHQLWEISFILLILESSGEWASSEQTKQQEKSWVWVSGCLKGRSWEARRKVNFQCKRVSFFKKEIQTQTRYAFGNLTQRKLSGPFLQSHFAFFFFFGWKVMVALYEPNQKHSSQGYLPYREQRKVGSKWPLLSILKCSCWTYSRIIKSRARKTTFHYQLKGSFNLNQPNSRQKKSTSKKDGSKFNSYYSPYQGFFKMSPRINSCDKKSTKHTGVNPHLI